MAKIEVTSHRIEVQAAKDEAIAKALKEIGDRVERYAKLKAPVDTGTLRRSIGNEVDGSTVYIGTNLEYALYLEFGTGKFAENGGRPTPWAYQNDDGEWIWTAGNKPQPFLRPAVEDHLEEYRQIVEETLKSE